MCCFRKDPNLGPPACDVGWPVPFLASFASTVLRQVPYSDIGRVWLKLVLDTSSRAALLRN